MRTFAAALQSEAAVQGPTRNAGFAIRGECSHNLARHMLVCIMASLPQGPGQVQQQWVSGIRSLIIPGVVGTVYLVVHHHTHWQLVRLLRLGLRDEVGRIPAVDQCKWLIGIHSASMLAIDFIYIYWPLPEDHGASMLARDFMPLIYGSGYSVRHCQAHKMIE